MLHEIRPNCRVLVVEDDYFTAMHLCGLFKSAGAEIVGPAPRVGDALQMLELSPDFVTLDVRLGDETSFAVADELARRDVPFVFVTGFASLISTAYGSRPICQKPFSTAGILQTLSQMMAT